MTRIYLDYNATTPLRSEAREAMIAAMDIVGNPSSVHAEGRAAKGILERARADIAEAIGADGQDIIFTSGATEAAQLGLAGHDIHCADVEHDAVRAHATPDLAVDRDGRIEITDPGQSSAQIANSETGVVQRLPEGVFLSDLTQGFGKIPLAFNWLGCARAIVSAHKLGGPKGVGALIVTRGTDIAAQIKGGGQEMGRRSGTENTLGVVGFAAAAKAAQRDLDAGRWDEIAALRSLLETRIQDISSEVHLVGTDQARLPNTLCMITPGWKGETQVMQMDLAGVAVSAGSACSSGKLRASATLRAMGYDDTMAASALRVSLGLGTRATDIETFAAKWGAAYRKFKARNG